MKKKNWKEQEETGSDIKKQDEAGRNGEKNRKIGEKKTGRRWKKREDT